MKADKMFVDFKKFHQDNPTVYQELRVLALSMRMKGRDKYGIGSLFEVLRWQRAMQTTGSEFKLNNNYRSFYARMLMERNMNLKEFFFLRDSRADEYVDEIKRLP